MTALQRLQLRASEIRQRLNELAGYDGDLSDEQRTEVDTLTAEYRDVETRTRAAMVAEPDETREAVDEPRDGETRERADLRRRSRIGAYVAAAINGTEVRGAEAECSAAFGCAGQVPLELFARERADQVRARAVTPSPSEVGQNLAPIVPAIFDRSAAAWLGIEMPMVGAGDAGYPVLSTSVTGGPKAKSAAAAETAGAFTVAVAQPRRVTGSFRFTLEDAARLQGMEEALRMNIGQVLSDAVDDQAINGTATGDGTLNGLLNRLADPSAPAAGVETFARYVAAARRATWTACTRWT